LHSGAVTDNVGMRDLFAFATGAASGALLLAYLRHRSEDGAAKEPLLECVACTGASEVPKTDALWLEMAHAHRLRRTLKPAQSSFRVTAIIVFTRDDQTSPGERYTVGHNDEAWTLCNSACAERAAFLHLAALAQGAMLHVRAIYITSDAGFALTPGVLCREYMMSSPFTCESTRVVMEGSVGDNSRMETTLSALWPLPSVYTRLTRLQQEEMGTRLGAIVRRELESVDVCKTADGVAWAAAVAAAGGDGKESLHPVRICGCICIYIYIYI